MKASTKLKKVMEKYAPKELVVEKIDILSRLYQIWAMIPLTAGMNARKEIKKLIDEIKKEKTPKQELLKLLEDCTCSLGTTDYDMFAEKVIDWMGDVKKKA